MWSRWRSSAWGPNCETPIGAEPTAPPVKALPTPDTTVPALTGVLKTAPSGTTTNLVVHLYTTASSPNYLSVSGVPASYAVGKSPNASGLTWHPATITGWDRMQAVDVTLSAGEGKKTLYFFLKNAKGTSPAYAVDVTYVDLTPCKLSLTRASSATYGASTTTQLFSIARGQSRAWTSDGTLMVSAENNGTHSITVGYVSADCYGDEYGQAKEFTLGPGGADFWSGFRSVKYAKCP